MIKNILPSLKYIMDNEKHPSVSTLVVGLYSKMADQLGVDYISTAILPVLQPMLVDKALNKAQFEMVATLTKDLLIQVLDDRGRSLGLGPGFHNSLSKAGLNFFDDAETVVASTRSQLEKSAPVATSSGMAGLGGVGTARGLPTGGGENAFGIPPPPPTSAAPKSVHLSPVSSPTSLHKPVSSNNSNAGIFGISPTAYGDTGTTGIFGGNSSQAGGGAFHLPSPPTSGKYDNNSTGSTTLDPFSMTSSTLGGGATSSGGYQPPMNLTSLSSLSSTSSHNTSNTSSNGYQPPMNMGTAMGSGGTDLASQIAQTQKQIAALQMAGNGGGMAPLGGMGGGAPQQQQQQQQQGGILGMNSMMNSGNLLGGMNMNNGVMNTMPSSNNPMSMNNGMMNMGQSNSTNISNNMMGGMGGMGGYQAPQPSMMNNTLGSANNAMMGGNTMGMNTNLMGNVMMNNKKDDPFDFLN